jgi:poly(3-hydroxyalkanoate) synthetase
MNVDDGMSGDRPRSGPRPLGLYLQVAMAAPAEAPDAGRHLRAARIDAAPPIDPELFLAGVAAYWRHPYRRAGADRPTCWQEGPTRLRDFGGGGMPVLVVPSLVNRACILDLMPERSFLAHLAGAGLRPLLLDWGAPAGAELSRTLADQILTRAQRALDAVLALTGQRPVLLGYCMGGLLACALAQARQHDLAGLALLATPWDFHAGGSAGAPLLAANLLPLTQSIATLGCAPADLLQTFFALLDPLGVIAKFQRFAGQPHEGPRARRFVAVEDWLHDGVPLAGPVAQECLWQWYIENRPARGLWSPGGTPVRPETLDLPAFVAIPRHDRIVSAGSATALSSTLPRATVVRPAAGHVSMLVGEHAPEQLWHPITEWLRRIAPRRSGLPVRPACAIA